MTRSFVRLFAALVLALTVAFPAFAQDRPAQDGGVRVEELQKLVATLESDGERQQLVQQLKAMIAAQRHTQQDADNSVLGVITERLEAFGDDAMDAVAALRDVPKLMTWMGQQAADPALRKHWADTAWRMLALMLAGIAADHLLVRLLRRSEGLTVPREKAPMLVRLPLGLARAAIRTLPVAGAAAAAWGTLTILGLTGNIRVAAVMVVTAYASVRLLMVLARLLAAPRTPGLRLLPVDDETAEYLVIWARRLAGVGVFGTLAVEAARLLGLPRGAAVFSLKALGLAITTMLVIFILQNRQAVTRALRGVGDGSGRLHGLRTRLAEIWHVLAVLYVIAGYAVWALKVKGGFDFMLRASLLSVLILTVAAMLSTGLGRLIERGFAISQEARNAFPRLEARANRYLPVLHLVLRGAVGVVTMLALAQAWGLDTLALLSSEGGRRVVSSLISIAAVLTGALVVWELVSGAIERYLAATDQDGNALQRSGRIRTLLPLVRNALFIVLVVMVTLIVLSELGINIAPLLAGAGVVGVAIGFGSQTLVKDVITGAFILFEDTMAVGDSVKINGNTGTLEAMSIRAIRLRDGTGAVHSIPFSSVNSVVNMSRDHAFANLEVSIGLGEDVDRVMEVMREVGADLRGDAVVGPSIVAPMDIWGLDRFDASAAVITGRFKTLPGRSGAVSREFNRRLKKRFHELGIEMPGQQPTVVVHDHSPTSVPTLRVAGKETVAALPTAG
ncbi:MAG TPA: mechanosensitive ion channel domain-containing protein [Magnetospirillum sp.]|nr:mechanosensitive ion channel domain-containing protein [Magnetospirillum sp.]